MTTVTNTRRTYRVGDRVQHAGTRDDHSMTRIGTVVMRHEPYGRTPVNMVRWSTGEPPRTHADVELQAAREHTYRGVQTATGLIDAWGYAALAIVTEDPDVARITVPALGFDPLRLDDLASAWRNADALAGDDPSRRNVDNADDAAGVLTDYLNGDRA